jgi:hypothetical protein
VTDCPASSDWHCKFDVGKQQSFCICTAEMPGCDSDCDGVMSNPTGSYRHYVQHELRVPRTSSQSASYAMDVDLDGDPENAVGSLLAVLGQNGGDPAAASSAAVTRGDLLHLYSFRADDLVTDQCADVRLFTAKQVAGPDFSGAGSFEIAGTSSLGQRFYGGLAGGRFAGGPPPRSALVQIVLYRDGSVVNLPLWGARLGVMVTENGCDGRIGGGVQPADLDATFVPAYADAYNDIVQAGGPNAAAVRGVFDKDGDGYISTDEVKTGSVTQALFQPDLDLFDADGNYHPFGDGVKDAISVGLGFGCVKAVFSAPDEN